MGGGYPGELFDLARYRARMMVGGGAMVVGCVWWGGMMVGGLWGDHSQHQSQPKPHTPKP